MSKKKTKSELRERKLGKKELRKKMREGRKAFVGKVANYLQNNTPKSELWFYDFLREAGIEDKFEKNVPLCSGIPDLCNKIHKIVIEVDGSIHTLKKVKIKDQKRHAEYVKAGYSVFRVIHEDSEGALKVIERVKAILNQVIRKEKNNYRSIKDVKVSTPYVELSVDEQVSRISQIMGNVKTSRPKKTR